MLRIDKVLSQILGISRTDAKKLLKKQSLKVNGTRVTDADFKVDTDKDEIVLNGEKLNFKRFIYIMMNKPKGVISASNDPKVKTVVDLVPEALSRPGLFPAGRLDSDTTGFVLITDDGNFAHKILSPKNHVEKTYTAELERNITEDDIDRFLSGIELKDGTLCLEAKLRKIGEREAEIIIHEGKYHQVKRMFATVGNRVLELKRVKIGNLELDKTLKSGECREITDEELRLISKC